jgi:hypothetical protein
MNATVPTQAPTWRLRILLRKCGLFAVGTADYEEPKPFVRVDDKCPGEKLAAMMMYHWRFGTKQLGVMISVVGSSFDDVDLPVSTQSAVTRGLAAFASNVNAVVVTSGLDQGVSKMIGDSAASLQGGDHDVPFVGVAAWCGTCHISLSTLPSGYFAQQVLTIKC